jgi:hypothetical protein
MNNPNLLEQLAAATPVGSGDLLGCWLRIVWLIIFVAWLVVFIMWLKCLVATIKCHREYQKTQRECRQYIRQMNEALRVGLQSHGRLLGNLAQVGKDDSHIEYRCRVQFRMVARFLGALKHAYQAASNFLSMLFGGHKSNKRKQPNMIVSHDCVV